MHGIGDTMLAIDFAIHHYGCPACTSTERFQNVEMKILSSKTFDGNKATVMQYAHSDNRSDVEDFLGYWKKHGAVTKFSVADKLDKDVIFNVKLRSEGCWVTKAVFDNDAVFNGPISVIDGLEYWSVLVGEGQKNPLLAQLGEIGVVEINRIQKLNLHEVLSGSSVTDLTPRQFFVLKTAYETGYFSSPRKISSRELANIVGVSQSTLLEHLRKAELKVMKQIINHHNVFST
jgi:predicted DNA binding protein